jgi:hypothetical protein
VILNRITEEVEQEIEYIESAPPPPANSVDLVVTGLRIPPDAPQPLRYDDRSAEIVAVVENRSTVTLPGFSYRYWINDFDSPGEYYSVIEPGETIYLPISIHDGYAFFAERNPEQYPSGPGTYTFVLHIDQDNELGDVNPGNNKGSKQFTFQ